MHKILVFLISVFFVAPAVAASLINDTETERVIGRLVEPLARSKYPTRPNENTHC